MSDNETRDLGSGVRLEVTRRDERKVRLEVEVAAINAGSVVLKCGTQTQTLFVGDAVIVSLDLADLLPEAKPRP